MHVQGYLLDVKGSHEGIWATPGGGGVYGVGKRTRPPAQCKEAGTTRTGRGGGGGWGEGTTTPIASEPMDYSATGSTSKSHLVSQVICLDLPIAFPIQVALLQEVRDGVVGHVDGGV